MSDFYQDVIDFHEKFGHKATHKPRVLEFEMFRFRMELMMEELKEYETAHRNARHLLTVAPEDKAEINVQLEHVLDGLVDLVYVVLGTAYFHGFDVREAWRRVHEANMKKVRASNALESKRKYSLDIVKPQGWQPPYLSDLVEDNEHSGS